MPRLYCTIFINKLLGMASDVITYLRHTKQVALIALLVRNQLR